MRKWFRYFFSVTPSPVETATTISKLEAAALAADQGKTAMAAGDFAAAAEHFRIALVAAPGDAKLLLNLGFVQKELGQLDAARASLEQALITATSLPDASYLLGVLARDHGDAPGAIAHWRAALEQTPDFEIAYLDLCRLLLVQGDTDSAQALIEQGLRYLPLSADLHFYLGNLRHETQNFALAQASFEQALKLQPDRADILANMGLVLFKQSKFPSAIDALRHALSLESFRADAHLTLGNAYLETDNPEAAIPSFEHALSIVPDYLEAWNGLGYALQHTGDMARAISCFQQAIALRTHHLSANFNLANALFQQGEWHASAEQYRKVLQIVPNHAQAQSNLGTAVNALGQHTEAIFWYRSSLALDGQSVDTLNNLGASLLANGETVPAADSYRRAVAIDPHNIASLLGLAHALNVGQLFREAIEIYESILVIEPEHLQAQSDLGIALLSLGLAEEARKTFSKVLALAPDNHDLLVNLGSALEDCNDPVEAIAMYQRALSANPDSVPARINIAGALTTIGRHEEAVERLDEVLGHAPDHADAHYSRALISLRLGDYRSGWSGYEYRWKRTNAPDKALQSGKQWQGEDISGKTIFLYPEQGLGDTIQFARYINKLAALDAKIILQVQPPLRPLFDTFPGVAQLLTIDKDNTLPAFDFQSSLLSLPQAFKTELSTIPTNIPYLTPSIELMKSWQERLAQCDGPRIGVVWSGNPLHKSDHNRSLILSQFAPLWRDTRRTFLSLQKDVRELDLPLLRQMPSVIDLSEQLTDFAQTAAIIANLDLVISVDSSVAHLTGALGVPVWILLPHFPDFRWLMDRQDSPWYPTARLFRQPAAGDWRSVIADIRTALDAQFPVPPSSQQVNATMP